MLYIHANYSWIDSILTAHIAVDRKYTARRKIDTGTCHCSYTKILCSTCMDNWVNVHTIKFLMNCEQVLIALNVVNNLVHNGAITCMIDLVVYMYSD